jgi:hypothetical protein
MCNYCKEDASISRYEFGGHWYTDQDGYDHWIVTTWKYVCDNCYNWWTERF